MNMNEFVEWLLLATAALHAVGLVAVSGLVLIAGVA